MEAPPPAPSSGSSHLPAPSSSASPPAHGDPSYELLKLFVGQVPRHFAEQDLYPIFAPFGQIRELSVLRDRITGTSKGCAFVTFTTVASVQACVAALHDQHTLPQMPNPMQLRPASTIRKQEDRKLFVGMTSKNMTDVEIRTLFEPFGVVEDIVVLRNPDGSSKGCAFVKMGSRAQAQHAIAGLHHSRTLEGCRWPLVVKFADTERDKVAKLMQVQMEQYFPYSTAFHAQPFIYPPVAGGPSFPSNGPPGPGMQGMRASPHYNLSSPMSPPAPAAFPTERVISSAGHGGMPNLGGLYIGHNGSSGHSHAYPRSQHAAHNGGGEPSAASTDGVHPGGATSAAAAAGASGAVGAAGVAGTVPALPPRPPEGPEGSNLFIYHLPQEFTDESLASAFAPFGNVLSAKVFLDHVTHQSKCFGFVSFDNPLSAMRAIEIMNGHQIGTKRLKVALKKNKPSRDGSDQYAQDPMHGGWPGMENGAQGR